MIKLKNEKNNLNDIYLLLFLILDSFFDCFISSIIVSCHPKINGPLNEIAFCKAPLIN